MPTFVYNGDADTQRLWGVDFPRGVPVKVEDPGLVHKCRSLKSWLEQPDQPAKQPKKTEPKAEKAPEQKARRSRSKRSNLLPEG